VTARRGGEGGGSKKFANFVLCEGQQGIAYSKRSGVSKHQDVEQNRKI